MNIYNVNQIMSKIEILLCVKIWKFLSSLRVWCKTCSHKMLEEIMVISGTKWLSFQYEISVSVFLLDRRAELCRKKNTF